MENLKNLVIQYEALHGGKKQLHVRRFVNNIILGGHKGPCAINPSSGRCKKSNKSDGNCYVNLATGRCRKKRNRKPDRKSNVTKPKPNVQTKQKAQPRPKTQPGKQKNHTFSNMTLPKTKEPTSQPKPKVQPKSNPVSKTPKPNKSKRYSCRPTSKNGEYNGHKCVEDLAGKYSTKNECEMARCEEKRYNCEESFNDGQIRVTECVPRANGKFNGLQECQNTGCEKQEAPQSVDSEYTKVKCRKKWCQDPNLSWKKCYRKNAFKLHPDKIGQDPVAQRQLRELNSCNMAQKESSEIW